MSFTKTYSKYIKIALIVALFFIGGAFVPNFLKIGNLLNVGRQCSIIAICAVGVTMVIIIKGIDLSVGGNVSCCGMITGMLLLNGVNVTISILAGLASGVLFGLITGLIVAKLEVPAFISTLVIGQITQGLAFLMNGGRSFGGFSELFVFLGNGDMLSIPISNYVMVLFVAAGVFVMTKLPIGSHIYGLGGNEQVLKNQGVNTSRIKVFVFAVSGFCSAAAGILLAAQLDTVHPMQGEPYQLDAIAACVIGGVNMAGGEGKVGLSLVGALVIGSMRNVLNLLGVHPFYQNIFVGAIIIAVVAITMLSRLRRQTTSKFAVGNEAN